MRYDVTTTHREGVARSPLVAMIGKLRRLAALSPFAVRARDARGRCSATHASPLQPRASLGFIIMISAGVSVAFANPASQRNVRVVTHDW